MKNTIKKVASIGLGATMLAATMTGAIAANLNTLPAPFVQNGTADVQIVIGSTAQTIDVIGAVDIATGLSEVTTTTVPIPGKTTTSVEGGVSVSTSSDLLLLNEATNEAQTTLDDSDLSDLLADGTVTEEDDNEDYDYKQTFTLSADPTVKFGESDVDTDLDDPTLVLDLDSGSDVLWTYTLDFTGSNINLTELDDSETITMLGKVFTFSPTIDSSGEIKLFGSDETALLNLNEPKTFVIEGKSYTVSVVGGNSDNDNVIISVNGQQKTVEEGETATINGLEIYAKDVFVTNIPTLSASATVFVGSQEVVLQGAAASPSWSDVEIGSDTINGLQSRVTGTNNGAVDKIEFQYKPTDLNGDVAGFDETNYLLAGESISDPLFGTFKVLFEGPTADLDDASKTMFSISAGSDDVEVTFTNDDGDEISFTPFTLSGGNAVSNNYAVESQGFNGTLPDTNTITDDVIFVLNEGSSSPYTTYVFEVVGFAISNNENVTRLKNLATGKTEEYGNGDKVIDGVTVDAMSTTGFSLSAATSDLLYVEGGENYINLSTYNASAPSSTVARNITYVESDLDQVASGTSFIFALSYDSNDDETNVAVTTSGGTVQSGTQDNGDVKEYLSQYGTYVVEDVDEQVKVDVWTPKDEDNEVSYAVFFAPTDASVVVSGGSDGVTTQKVTQVSVGAAIQDTELGSIDSAKTNLIVVGGPCVNSAARELLNLPATGFQGNCAEGFTAGTARIELFNLANGKVAMLVAGYEGQDTRAASRAVATRDPRLMGTSAVLTVTSATEYSVKSN